MFTSINLEPNKTFESFLFKANKLINKDKTKYTLFHKIREKDNISLKLLILLIGDENNESGQLNFWEY